MAFEILEDAPTGRFEVITEAEKPTSRAQFKSAIGSIMDPVNNYSGANPIGGAIRGAGSIGSTLIRPFESKSENDQRRVAIDAGLTSAIGSDPESTAYKTTKLGAEIAGTSGIGGALAKGLAFAPKFASSVASGGMLSPGANVATRIAGGAITGGASAGLVNPEDAGMGAAIGSALPAGVKLLGATGRAIGSSLSGGGVSPEVAALAKRAADLGIDVPADRLVNSKPLNALAATLNYVPFSGRAATEARMGEQLNTALSRTFGQDSSNVTQALRKASGDLGSEFDKVLQANSVKLTPAFKTALANAESQAVNELGPDSAGIILKQIANIQTMGANGAIDGQAAYNIKKTLDRIGNRNSPEAFYARDLKKSLMDALNDSLGAKQAAEFANVRKQYGNMLSLENLAQNGADGGVSIGRLANMKNIRNNDLQELADISSQFLKSRENPHGAAQRTMMGLFAAGTGGLAGLPYVAGGALVGRGANSALNSNAVRGLLTDGAPQIPVGGLLSIGQKAAPVFIAQ